MDLPPEFLSGLGVRALLLDVDNTVASYTSHQPIPGAVEWAKRMVEAGFRVLIVSNNFKKRVEPFAAQFGLGCIFTDVIGANLCGMKSVLLSPIEEEEGFTFRVRRHFEKGLRRKFENRRDIS